MELNGMFRVTAIWVGWTVMSVCFPCLGSNVGDSPQEHFFHALPGLVANFVLLVVILLYVGWRPLKKMFQDRANDIEAEVKKNNELYARTLGEFQRYGKLLEGLENERKETIQNAHKEGARLVENERKSGQKAAERYVQEAKESLLFKEGEKKRELMLHLLSLAMNKMIEESQQTRQPVDRMVLEKFAKTGTQVRLFGL